MVSHFVVFALFVFSMMAGIPAQRSPYLHSSDPGVLPMYLPEGSENRFGGEDREPPKVQKGTLETEDLYNRVADWPDQHKPFWYLNAVALQNQRGQQQQRSQATQAQAQNRQSPFVSSFLREFSRRQK